LLFSENIKTRFAPTPSGFLHLGNAFSFILTWLIARKNQGQIVLRIDDLDTERSQPEYIQDVFDSLAWLKLDYDEGPKNAEDFSQNYSQKLRLSSYLSVLKNLENSQFIYACDCSRKQIQAQSPTGIYPKTCRELNLGLNNPAYAWRVKVPDNQVITLNDWQKGKVKIGLGAEMGDFIIKRKEQIPAYQLVSLVDDLEFGINFIIRGEDLWSSSAAQVYLANIAQLADFQQTIFYHHPLIKDFSGKKLSKSAGTTSLQYLRKQGLKPNLIYQLVAENLGISPHFIQSLEDLLQHFAREQLANLGTKINHWQLD
jgi:glutamyl-tRNA synthetase